jgi:hypothetical protein
MQIVLDLPAQFKPLLDEVALFVRVLAAKVEEIQAEPRTDYAQVEREVARHTAAIERHAHSALLRALDIDAPEVRVGREVHRRVGRYPATHHTAAGPVVVERSIYRPAAPRNAPTVDPVSLRAGVVGEGWLPDTARAMAFLLQQGTAREAHATARELGRLPFAVASFERVAHAVGTLAVARQEVVEQTLIEVMEVPPEAQSVSVSLDRVSVPIEEPRARPRGRPAQGAPKRPVTRAWRMAYCATVSLHDAEGKTLRTLRYGRMPATGATTLCEGLCEDVLALLKKRPDLRVMGLCDGAQELWSLLDEHLGVPPITARWVCLVDLWHLLEKLGHAARAVHGEAESDATVERWRLQLLNRRGAWRQVEAEISGWDQREGPSSSDRPVHDALTFLGNQGAAGRLEYAAARRAGLPVGSGNVEATCKSLFSLRFKRPGARWKHETGEHIVTLRAWALSDRWEEAIALTLEPLRQKVRPMRAVKKRESAVAA